MNSLCYVLFEQLYGAGVKQRCSTSLLVAEPCGVNKAFHAIRGQKLNNVCTEEVSATTSLITSANDVMQCPNARRLSVCLLAIYIKTTERVFTKILPQTYLCTGMN